MKRVILGALAILGVHAFAEDVSELGRLRESYKAAITRAVTPLTATYVKELQKLRDAYTRAGNLKLATDVDAELKSLTNEADHPVDAAGHTIVLEARAQIPANDPNGYRVGAVKKGDLITLTYVSGKWKNDGNVPSEDPDVGGSSRGDDIRLVISKATKTDNAGPMITMVRPGTANKPFTYTFPMDHDDVVLRIRTGTKNSPGAVVYNVKVTR